MIFWGRRPGIYVNAKTARNAQGRNSPSRPRRTCTFGP